MILGSYSCVVRWQCALNNCRVVTVLETENLRLVREIIIIIAHWLSFDLCKILLWPGTSISIWLVPAWIAQVKGCQYCTIIQLLSSYHLPALCSLHIYIRPLSLSGTVSGLRRLYFNSSCVSPHFSSVMFVVLCNFTVIATRQMRKKVIIGCQEHNNKFKIIMLAS